MVKMLGNFVCDKTVHTIKKPKCGLGHFPNSSPIYPFIGKDCYSILGKVMLDFGVPSIEV